LHLTRDGGRGAVRQFAEILLKARGEWNAIWEAYVAERSVDHETRVHAPHRRPRTAHTAKRRR
jgi:hypothetical protein